jgi:hypothetical protein
LRFLDPQNTTNKGGGAFYSFESLKDVSDIDLLTRSLIEASKDVLQGADQSAGVFVIEAIQMAG